MPSPSSTITITTPSRGVRWRTSRGCRTPRAALPGLAVTTVIALGATQLGQLLPTVGGPIVGILAGAIIGTVLRRYVPAGPVESLRPGFAVAGRQVLQASIVLLGAGLPLSAVFQIGIGSLPVMLGTLAVALAGAWYISRLLGVHPETGLLIGVGTGVCGASAIAAVTAVVGAAQARVAYALGTIFTFNIAAVLLFPPLGHWLGLSQQGFGLWSGTAINDTSSVVAAAYSFGEEAGTHAVVVKLIRSLMIVPICLTLLLWRSRSWRTGRQETTAARTWRAFPLFVVGFLATSAVATVGAIPASWHAALSTTSVFLITVSLSGIGLSLRWSHVRAAGPRPLLLGAILWILVGTASIGLQALTGQL